MRPGLYVQGQTDEWEARPTSQAKDGAPGLLGTLN